MTSEGWPDISTELDRLGVSRMPVERSLRQPSGRDRAQERMDQAIEHGQEEYKERFRGLVQEFADSGNRFVSEDITAIVGMPPPGSHPNLVGALMGAAATRGIIRKTGDLVYSDRHGSEIRYWVGVG